MMDCNTVGSSNPRLPQAGESASSAAATLAPETREHQRNDFSNMVEDKAPNKTACAHEEQKIQPDMSATSQEEEEQIAVPSIASLLYLTQIVHKLDTQSHSAEHLASLEENKMETALPGKSSTVLAGIEALVVTNKTKAAFSEAIPNRDNTQDNKKLDATSLSQGKNTTVDATILVEKLDGQQKLVSSAKGTSPVHGNSALHEKITPQEGVRSDLVPTSAILQKQAETAVSSDKIGLKNSSDNPVAAGSDPVSTLDKIHVIFSRKQGDLTLLHLQLKPDNLGTVEAKIRLEKDLLRVELSAATPQAARILAKDQNLLMQTLEKAGFSGDLRLSLSIFERSGLSAQAITSPSSFLQGDTVSANPHHDQTPDREGRGGADSAFSPDGEGKRHAAPQQDHFKQQHRQSLKPSPAQRYKNAFLSSRRLVV